MKLSTKVNVFTTLVASIILGCSFIGVYFMYNSLAKNTEYDQLLSRADDLAMAINSLETQSGIDTLIRAYLPTDGYILVVDEKDEPIIRMQATNVPLPGMDEVNEPYEIFELEHVQHLAISYPLIWPEVGIATAYFVQPIPHIAENLQLLQMILISLMIIAVIPIYLASSLLARIITQPITSLTSLMRKNIERHTFEQVVVKPRSKDEIADMTRTYNQLMNEIEQSYMKQQQFIGNASHELKTPLTVIESYANLLNRRGFQDEAINNEALDAILTESQSLKKLVDQMLVLAKSKETAKLTHTSFDVLTVTQKVATQMAHTFNRTINVKGDSHFIESDGQTVQQILTILLDNARKFSSDAIQLRIEQRGTDIGIAVIDNGIGIPTEDLPLIFDRFYRVAKDRNRKSGGTGLGLAIAHELATMLGGRLTIESVVDQGTTVHLVIPMNREVPTDEQ